MYECADTGLIQNKRKARAYTRAMTAMAPANANAAGLFVGAAAAPLVTWRGADVTALEDGGGTAVVTIVVGAVTNAVVGAAGKVVVSTGVAVENTVSGTVENTVPPGKVAVFSEGNVRTSVTGVLVAKVRGTRTVAFVVGGSVTDVTVKADVTRIVSVAVNVCVTVLPEVTRVVKVSNSVSEVKTSVVAKVVPNVVVRSTIVVLTSSTMRLVDVTTTVTSLPETVETVVTGQSDVNVVYTTDCTVSVVGGRVVNATIVVGT